MQEENKFMDLKEIEKIANKLRQIVLASITNAKSGHVASSLGLSDLFAYLYFKYLNTYPQDAWNTARDRLILSSGHTCPILYASLALKGFFPLKDTLTLRDITSTLQGHPHFRIMPGVENTSGPLGQGISQSIGVAIALQNTSCRVVCIISDGELQEGQTWEALMKIGNSNLKNLTVIIDYNNIQISDFVDKVMPIEPLISKLEAFNLVVYEADGNDVYDLNDVFSKRDLIEKPVVVVAKTVPAKGISFMENDYKWHSKLIDETTYKKAILELQNCIY